MSLHKSLRFNLMAVCLIVAVCLTPGMCGRNCSWQASIAASKKCISDAGLSVPVDIYNNSGRKRINEFLYEHVISKYGVTFCSPNSRRRFQSAMECQSLHRLKCTETNSPSLAKRMASMVEPLCKHRHDIDFKCVIQGSVTVAKCTLDHLPGRQKATQCRVTSVTIDCIKRNLADCGCQTSKVYSDGYLDLILPFYCPKRGLNANRVVCNATHPNVFDYIGYDSSSKLSFTVWMLVLCILAIRLF